MGLSYDEQIDQRTILLPARYKARPAMDNLLCLAFDLLHIHLVVVLKPMYSAALSRSWGQAVGATGASF